jgi:ADP-ribose pyrophosphatase YjhB (NUDIX family)
MENGETIEDGAIRETAEEANAKIKIRNLQSVYSIPHINQVYMVFLSDLVDLDFFPGEESLEVELFREEEIPWNEIAFTAVQFSLENFFADRKLGNLDLTRLGQFSKPQTQY